MWLGNYSFAGYAGPIYSVVYTAVAINPDSTLAKMTAPDPDIPKGVEGLGGMKFQNLVGVVERLSWTMLGKPPAQDVSLEL
jgi:hypothetical protein